MQYQPRMRLRVGMGSLVLGILGCHGEFASSTVPTVLVEPVAVFPDTMSHSDSARLQVRLQVNDEDSSAALGVRVAWASSDSLVVEVEQDTAPAGSDGLQRLTAGLSATIRARRPGQAVITVSIQEGAGIAHRVALTRSVTVLERWIALSAGAIHTCALNVDSAAFCWGGGGGFGLLGNGTTSGNARPSAVAGLSGLRLVGISAGEEVTCAREVGGVLFCWGRNGHGEAGDGSLNTHLFPSDGGGGSAYITISIGSHHACGVEQVSRLTTCWGSGSLGELGESQSSSQVPCEFVQTLQGRQPLRNCTPAPDRNVVRQVLAFPPLQPIRASSVSSGGVHSCAIVSGEVVCWGVGTVGQLADGDSVPLDQCNTLGVFGAGLVYTQSFPCRSVALKFHPGPFREVTAGWDANFESHTCALGSDSTAYCWGKNSSGELGTSSSDPLLCVWDADSSPSPLHNAPHGVSLCRRSPTAVEGGQEFSTIGAGVAHTCAIGGLDSLVYCWGGNSVGQLGDGSAASRSNPLPVVPASPLRFARLSVGAYHTCGIAQPAGAIYCWGGGVNGQLGNGQKVNQNGPVRVTEPRN